MTGGGVDPSAMASKMRRWSSIPLRGGGPWTRSSGKSRAISCRQAAASSPRAPASATTPLRRSTSTQRLNGRICSLSCAPASMRQTPACDAAVASILGPNGSSRLPPLPGSRRRGLARSERRPGPDAVGQAPSPARSAAAPGSSRRVAEPGRPLADVVGSPRSCWPRRPGRVAPRPHGRAASLCFRLDAQLAHQCVRAELVLAPRGRRPALRRVQTHEGAMGRFAQRVERQEPESRLDGRVRRLRLDLCVQQRGQHAEAQLMHALAFTDQPALERGLVEAMPSSRSPRHRRAACSSAASVPSAASAGVRGIHGDLRGQALDPFMIDREEPRPS